MGGPGHCISICLVQQDCATTGAGGPALVRQGPGTRQAHAHCRWRSLRSRAAGRGDHFEKCSCVHRFCSAACAAWRVRQCCSLPHGIQGCCEGCGAYQLRQLCTERQVHGCPCDGIVLTKPQGQQLEYRTLRQKFETSGSDLHVGGADERWCTSVVQCQRPEQLAWRCMQERCRGSGSERSGGHSQRLVPWHHMRAAPERPQAAAPAEGLITTLQL